MDMTGKKALLALALAAASTGSLAVPVQWSSGVGGNDHWYEFVATPVNWSTALSNAAGMTHAGMQGYLATVTSAAELGFIRASVTTAIIWLGGTDEWNAANESDEGIWKWVTGPEAGQIFFGPGAPGGSYAPWSSFEPNNCCGGEDYVQMNWNSLTGAWNDHGGPGNPGQVNGYLVEYSAAVPSPAALPLIGLGLFGLGLGRRRT